MKKALLFFLIVTSPAICQETDKEVSQESGPVIVFEEEVYDFGDIIQGEKVEHTFRFENGGDEPLILSNVLTTCGCTATDWPRDPIAPGKSGEISVNFNSAGRMGRQNKIVTVLSNASNSQAKIRIVTNILPPDRN
jgi:hypothetical protein